MRILLLCNKSPWPPKDGGATATLNMIRGLSAMNASVTVLALNTSRHPVSIDEIPAELKQTVDIKLININTTIDRTELFINLFLSGKPYNLQRFNSPEFSIELAKIIRSKFDIIQIEGLPMYHYLPVIRQNTTVPVVFRPHNIENLIWSRLADEEKNLVKKLYFTILSRRIKKTEKKIINDFDGVVAISEVDLRWFKNEGLTKPAQVIVPGYFPGEIVYYPDINQGKVFFIGALDWLPNIYGLKWFIEKVWPVIIRIIPAAEFYIAGRNASEKTIAGLKGPNIIFKGEVDSSSDFIKDKTLMVVPLFSGSGIRMKIIEGLSHGKCVVATPLAAEGLDYENKKDIHIASGVSEFADNIIELLRNADRRKEVAENAVKNVRKNYNILASSDKLMNFYRELLHDN
jgi:glycosyltransferase involved in cell wall biosynthesis